MSAHHIVSGEIRIAHDISQEMMALFERLGDPHLQMIGEWSVGAAQFHLGALESAHSHLEKALTLYDPAFHSARVWQTGIEPGIFCRCELSRTWLLRGFPDTALAIVQEAVAAAASLDHPQPRAFALLFEMFAHLGRRSPRDVQRTYEQLAVVCHAHGIAQEMHWAAPIVGRALIEIGDLNRGLRVLEEGVAAHTKSRSGTAAARTTSCCSRERSCEPDFSIGHRPRWMNRRGSPTRPASTRTTPSTRGCRRKSSGRSGRPTMRSESIVRRSRRHSSRARGGWSCAPRAATPITSSNTAVPTRPARVLQPILSWFTEGRDTMDYLYAEGLLRTLD